LLDQTFAQGLAEATTMSIEVGNFGLWIRSRLPGVQASKFIVNLRYAKMSKAEQNLMSNGIYADINMLYQTSHLNLLQQKEIKIKHIAGSLSRALAVWVASKKI